MVLVVALSADCLVHFHQDACLSLSMEHSFTTFIERGRQDRMEEKQRYHYQYHHNYLPPPLPRQIFQCKRWGVERREEEPQKLSHTLIHAHSLFDQ